MRDEGHDCSIDDDVPTSSDGPILQLPPDVRQIGCIHVSRDTNLVRPGLTSSGRRPGLAAVFLVKTWSGSYLVLVPLPIHPPRSSWLQGRLW